MELNSVQTFVIWVLPVIFAITIHEAAHGWAAEKLGDSTAKMLGRLTLNPIKHIDPIGTILVPGFLYLTGGFLFGWAKPVPVTWENLKNPRRDVALVALAGPGANFIMALLWAFIMKLGFVLAPSPQYWLFPLILMGKAGIEINLILMLLNLLPILPLDGGRVLGALLPGPLAYKYSRLEPYGIFIVLGLLFLGILSQILSPMLSHLRVMMYSLVGL